MFQDSDSIQVNCRSNTLVIWLPEKYAVLKLTRHLLPHPPPLPEGTGQARIHSNCLHDIPRNFYAERMPMIQKAVNSVHSSVSYSNLKRKLSRSVRSLIHVDSKFSTF